MRTSRNQGSRTNLTTTVVVLGAPGVCDQKISGQIPAPRLPKSLLPLSRANFPQRLHSSRQTRQVKNGGDRRFTIGRGLGNETVGCQKLLEEGCGVARVERGLVICGERPLLILGVSSSQPSYDRRLLETKVRVPIDERVDLAALAADDQPNRITESRLPRRCTE